MPIDFQICGCVQLDVPVFRQRRTPVGGREAIDVQHSAQMVGLVLEDSRKQALGFQMKRRPAQVHPREPDAEGAAHRPVHAGDRETALLLVLIALLLPDLRVRHRTRTVAFTRVVDEQAERAADLIRGQPDTGSCVHGFGHVVGERSQRVIEDLYGATGLAKDGIAKLSDPMDAHAPSAPLKARFGFHSLDGTQGDQAHDLLPEPNQGLRTDGHQA